MKPVRILKLDENIYRITARRTGEDSLALRYGLIRLPQNERAVEEIPGLSFETKWDGCEEQLKRLEEEYRSIQPETIEGMPEMEKAQGMKADFYGRFFIRFPIAKDEKFFGLGEAGKDHLELRGKIYQNFTKYQADEIPIPLVMSDHGWGILINADGKHFVDVGCTDEKYLSCMGGMDELDVLVFKGKNLSDLLDMYTRLSGRPMVLPKWAYTLTYIAPIHADQFVVMDHAERFRKLGIPCHHISLEPGWMNKFYDMSLEKDWNLEKFHVPRWLQKREKPETFLSALRRMDYHVSLWLCIDYDLTDEAERQAGRRKENQYEPWYQHLEKFVNAGADGFKLDPANMTDPYRLGEQSPSTLLGTYSNGVPFEKMHNINQTLLPMQMYEGFARQMNKRPMLHYCGGYTGVQKWCAATTGDNGGQMGAMVWLLNLALSGCSNTTVDMDLYTPESVHFAFLAPWAHLNAWSGVRQPWYAGEKQFDMFTRYAKMRGRLLPYIYSAAIEANRTGVPMIRPFPLAFPGFDPGENLLTQYMLGPHLMVGCYTDTLHLPNETWTDAWTGDAIAGNRSIAYRPPEGYGGALLIREGAIIPSQENEGEMILNLFPGETGKWNYTLYEDDGESLDYEKGALCQTHIAMEAKDGEIALHIGRGEGNYAGKPMARIWRIRIRDTRKIRVSLENDQDRIAAIEAREKGLLF